MWTMSEAVIWFEVLEVDRPSDEEARRIDAYSSVLIETTRQ